jgi:hypothetical protein
MASVMDYENGALMEGFGLEGTEVVGGRPVQVSLFPPLVPHGMARN